MKRELGSLGIAIFFFVIIALGYLLLSSYGAFHSFLSWDARQTSWAWKIASIIPISGLALIVYKLVSLKWSFTTGTALSIFVLLIAWICFNVEFKFTGGDIKQRITCFQNPDGSPSLDGKVNPDCLKQYYNDFYHFDKDTALWNYVNTYHELPGVNKWAYNIRYGKTKPSTAPRANEDFEYHTGAYQMK